jgi:spore coat polysaccharide biosynthesis protein SpsF (cytidylyltransferase family)
MKAIIVVRCNSERFPNKAVANLAGRPMIEWIIKKLQMSGYEPVVATSTNESDDKLLPIAKRIGAEVYRGPEDDVLTRVIECFKYYDIDRAGQISGDSPFFDIRIMKRLREVAENVDGQHWSVRATAPHCPMGGDMGVVTFKGYIDFIDNLFKEHPETKVKRDAYGPIVSEFGYAKIEQQNHYWVPLEEFYPSSKTIPKTSIDFPLEMAFWNASIEKFGRFPETYDDIVEMFRTMETL